MSDSPARSSTLARPHEALVRLLEALTPLPAQTIATDHASGRVLAQQVTADRPSPACDVSAMDGYAVRLADLSADSLPVAGEIAMGQPPPALAAGKAMRIFTGGAIPPGAEAVIKREDVGEQRDRIDLPVDLAIKPGQHIRRRGENTSAGATVLEAGRLITAPVAAALANFGVANISVTRPVRVGVIVTGDELCPPHQVVQPWQLRDSNSRTLAALFRPLPWLRCERIERVHDELASIRDLLERTLGTCDAVILSGGVSMGDHDYVPAAVKAVGGRIVFHKLALRPGKPLLGAVGPEGQLILGLPGNPGAVMTTARRFAAPALRRLAGFAEPDPPAATVELIERDDKTLGLWWYRPVRLVASGKAQLVETMGSGDPVAPAASDGFVEIPPGRRGLGPWPFYEWTIGAIG